MRKTLVTALALFSCVGMLACGGDSTSLEDYLKEPTKKPSSSSTSDKTDSSNNKQDTPGQSSGDGSTAVQENPLFSFQVTEEGETYQFPCWYTELLDTEERDWICEEFAEDIVQPGEVMILGEDYDESVLVYNDTSKPQMALYCVAVGLRYNKDYFELIDPEWGIMDVRLPENIKVMTATKADIMAAYGTPTKVGTEDSFEVLTYEAGKNRYATLYLENDVLCEFEICNLDKPANDLPMSTDALYSFAISINGENYQLPLTAGELVARGWDPGFDIYSEKVEFNTGIPDSDQGVEVVWEKDGAYLVTFSMKQEPGYALLGEGEICGIEIGNDFYPRENVPNMTWADIRLPNGIQFFESKIGEVLGAYGSPTEYRELHENGEKIGIEYLLDDPNKLDERYVMAYVEFEINDYDEEDTLDYYRVQVLTKWYDEIRSGIHIGGYEAD